MCCSTSVEAVWSRFLPLARLPGLYHWLTGLGTGLLHRLGRKKGFFRKLPGASGWTSQREFPAPQGPSFMHQYKSQLKAQSKARR